MADADRIVVLCADLQLGSFSEEWVQKCWSEDFVDLGSLPIQSEQFLAETNYLTRELETLGQLVSQCLDMDAESDDGFWNVLVENNISHKTLIALLAYLCHKAGKVAISCQERLAGVLAASVYLKLAALPGSAAFKIFHPELFLQACRLLNKWNKTDLGGARKNKRRSSSQFSPSPKKKGRRGKKRRSDESLLNEEDEEEEEEHLELTEEESKQIDICMQQLLQDVLLMCEKFPLRQSVSTASQLMSVLISLSRMAPESVTEEMGLWNNARCSVGMLAYKGMFLLCQPLHGHVTSMTNQACKLLLNHILMMEDGKLFSNLVRPVLVMRKQGIAFIKLLMLDLGDRCVRSVKTLIQHISFKVPDKSDYRSYAAQAVYELLQILPDLEYASLLEWMKALSKHKKVAQRSFTIDVMSHLMEKPERVLTGVPPETAEFATHKSMVCTLLSRCSDSNASVCARALLAFSSSCQSNMSDVVSTLKGLITPNVGPQGRATAKHFVPTPKVTTGQRDEENSGAEGQEVEEEQGMDKENVETAVAGEGDQVPPPTDGDDACDKTADTPQAAREKSFANIALTPGFNPYLPDNEGVVSMFRRRVLDAKVVVRKSALQALQNVVKFEWPDYCEEDLIVLQERCADPALSVRKQCIQCVLELLTAFPQDKKIQRAWVYGLLPRVMDTETSVQEKCFDSLEEMTILQIKPHGRLSETGIEWDLLSIIGDEDSDKLRRYLQKACQHWCRMKKLKPSLVAAIESHIGGPNDLPCWMLLAELSKTTANVNPKTALNHWNTCRPSAIDDVNCFKWTNVLHIISAGVKQIPENCVTKLQDDLKQNLLEFSYPFEIIRGIVNTLSKLHICELGTSSRISQLKKSQAWGSEVIKACDKFMSDVILSAQRSQVSVSDEEMLVRYIVTLGEVCQRCPFYTGKRISLLIQSIIAEPCIGEFSSQAADSQSQKSGSSQQNSRDNSHESQDDQPDPASSQDGQLDPASSQEVQDSQTSQSQDSQATQSSQPSGKSQLSQVTSTQCSQPLSQFRGFTTSHKLRAHAFITLGKLCLMDEDLAKKTIAALARELEVSESAAVRNNVVIVMGDLTVRYTTLVDRYITNMAACLKDQDALVRKNTLTILTRLLQEEYVKWKGVLFFRYITTLLDEIEEIKHLAEFCLEHLFLKKHPHLFFNPFLECIFYFNNYTTHSVYNKFKQTEREKTMFTLAGPTKARQRMRLYTYMLEHMSDEQRFNTTAKLNKDILSAFVEGSIPLDENGGLILKDSLAILSCKEIKLSTMRTKPQEEDGGEEEVPNVAQIVTATAKKVLISQVLKRNVIENIVPVVIALKHLLEKRHSPILKNLMAYLRELMTDYKTDVKDILSADKQLAEEIEFDLKNFEKQQAERNRRISRRNSAVGTPSSSRLSTPMAVGSKERRLSSQSTSPRVAANNPPSTPHSPMASKEDRVLAEVGGENGEKTHPVSERRLSLNVSQVVKVVMSRVDELRQQETGLTPKKKFPGQQKAGQGQIRAISTPTRDIENITFQEDVDVTLLPPSPILNLAGSKGERTRQFSNSDSRPQSSTREPSVTKWNIHSPGPVKARESSKDKGSKVSNKGKAAEESSRRSLRISRKLSD